MLTNKSLLQDRYDCLMKNLDYILRIGLYLITLIRGWYKTIKTDIHIASVNTQFAVKQYREPQIHHHTLIASEHFWLFHCCENVWIFMKTQQFRQCHVWNTNPYSILSTYKFLETNLCIVFFVQQQPAYIKT